MLDSKKLKNIKLIVSDLDGTLLNGFNEIGKDSQTLIKALIAKGMRFTFATGRLHSAVEEHAKSLGLRTPLITLDGSIIKTISNEIIFESYLSRKHVKKSISLADYNLVNIALCHADAIYYTEHSPSVPQLIDKFGANFIEVDSLDNYLDETLEVVFAGDYKDSLKFIERKMTFPYTFGLDTSFYKSQRRGQFYFFEVRKHGSSKGKALERLLKYLKINIQNVAVIGDWHNDRTLFDTNAIKIAVDNAVSEIKSKADYITSRDNENDGVAEFLEMVLKAKE
ncbi:MAG: HAD family hydrolase [Bacteroidetes bacterium]|nr:HAD family hydrolase [Bacteroidota bacterium]MBU1117244.1 HAD family hydrolase [Bacteroidota bacterium]MBU1799623.1 HAD family hydrolase [Bacteroidota bacterium]